jgi:hypothetical protein
MRTPLARIWSAIRGDKYMVDAYPPAPDAAVADADAADRDEPFAPPSKER